MYEEEDYIKTCLFLKILIDEDTPLLLNLEGVVNKRKSDQDDDLGEESMKKYFKSSENGQDDQVDWNNLDFSVEKQTGWYIILSIKQL